MRGRLAVAARLPATPPPTAHLLLGRRQNPVAVTLSRRRRLAIAAAAFYPEKCPVPAALALPAPLISKFQIALCQMLVTQDKNRNIAHARDAIEEAAQKGAELVVLPEIWNCPYSNKCFPIYAECIDAGGDAAPSFSMLSEAACRLHITVVGGSIPERSGDQLYNTCCVFGTDGKLLGKHRKIHLFDIDIPGEITFKESETLSAGEQPTIVDTDVGRIGIGICHDIRFQELAMLYATRGLLIIRLPSMACTRKEEEIHSSKIAYTGFICHEMIKHLHVICGNLFPCSRHWRLLRCLGSFHNCWTFWRSDCNHRA